MTNRRIDSGPKLAEPAKVVRLVDAKSARKEATPPNEGIRPTREGPWDPCRFQEYEISPEFRQQLLSVKPPLVDPSIFAETMPPTPVAEIVPRGPPGDESQTVTFDPNEFSGAGAALATTKQSRRRPSKSSHWTKTLAIVGALLGVAAGIAVARHKKQDTKIGNEIASPGSAAVSVSDTVQKAKLPAQAAPLATVEVRVVASSAPLERPQEIVHGAVVGHGEVQAKTATPGSTSAKVRSTQSVKRSGTRIKNSQPDDSFPLSPDE